MNNSDYKIVKLFQNAYVNGDFSPLYEFFSENYKHISFWVNEVIRGKNEAISYYTAKGDAIRKSKKPIKSNIVKITNAPEKVRPYGVFENGVKATEDLAFINRQDNGKIAILFEQTIDGETIHTLAIPSINKLGQCCELLIANPNFYSWEFTE